MNRGENGRLTLVLPLGLLPARMLDHRIRAGKDQGDVLVLELHEVGRFPARSADLDDLTGPLGLTHDSAMYVDHIPDDCLHDVCLLGQGSRSPLGTPAVPSAPGEHLLVLPRVAAKPSARQGQRSQARLCGYPPRLDGGNQRGVVTLILISVGAGELRDRNVGHVGTAKVGRDSDPVAGACVRAG
jgi:hypothetical protein